MQKIRSTADGAELAVEIAGSGPAIVLMHALSLDRSSWDAQAERLAKRARVIRFDHRGCGESAVPPGPYLVEALAGDLHDVLDAAGERRATVVGHSIGGFVAYAFFRMFAERVAGLGIVTSRASADDDAARLARYAFADRIEREGIAALSDVFVPKFFAPDIYESDPAIVARLRAQIERGSAAGAAALQRGVAERVGSDDLFEDLAGIPVAIVAGRHDQFTSAEILAAEAAAIPGATYTVLPAGHLPQWEAPVELGDALEDLLDRVSGAS